MKAIETNHRTFSKAVRKQIKEECPTAYKFKRIGADVVIVDRNEKTVATWQKRYMKNGLLHIYNY